MLTLTLLVIVLIIYLILLIIRYTGKSKLKINGIIQIIQGTIWTLIAIDSWRNGHTMIRIAYIIIIVLSFASGVQEFRKYKQ